jgi:hypothetical protein
MFTIPPNTFKATTLEMKIVDVADLVTGADAITTQGDGTFYGSNISISKGSSILSAVEATVSVKEVTEQKSTTTTSTQNIQSVVVIPGPPAPSSDADPGGGGGCCFDPDAKVLMADGSWKRIADIVEGDKVAGAGATVNTVVGTKTTTVQDRLMIKFGGYNFFATDDHLFLTNNGWKTWRPDRLIDNQRENAIFLEGENRHHPIDSDDKMIVMNGDVLYSDLSVEEHIFDSDFVVHDLHLDGNQTYIVEGFIVHNCGGCGGEAGGGCGGGGGW